MLNFDNALGRSSKHSSLSRRIFCVFLILGSTSAIAVGPHAPEIALRPPNTTDPYLGNDPETTSFANNSQSVEIAPLLDVSFADPAILYHENISYTYSTNNLGVHIPVAVLNRTRSALDLMMGAPNSRTPHDALPKLPKWAVPTTSTIWAPHVVHLYNNTFIMYYSALWNVWPGGIHCVGAAKSTTGPAGPFDPIDDKTPFICDKGAGGAIDPSGYRDDNGKLYVVYKVDGNSLGGGGPCGNANGRYSTPLMLQEVDAKDGFSKKGGPRKLLDRIQSDGPYIEAPNIVRLPNGPYALFFSSNCYRTPDYNVNYATAPEVTGPYTRGPKPLISTGDLGGLVAPGGASASCDGRRIVFHAEKNSENAARLLYTSEIQVFDKEIRLAGGIRGQHL